MDGHTKLVIGGAATVAMSVAVVVAVAVSTAGALTDVPGAPVTQAALLVPSSSGQPGPAPALLDQSTSVAETVPAIAPAVIPPPSDVPVAPSVLASDPEQHVADTWRKSGDRTAAREWAAARGWSTERLEAWIAEMADARDDRDGRDERHREDRDERDARDREDRDGYRRTSPETPASAGDTSEDDLEWSHRGLKKEQSPTSPDWRD